MNKNVTNIIFFYKLIMIKMYITHKIDLNLTFIEQGIPPIAKHI